MVIKKNIDNLRVELGSASCRLIAVSKTQPVSLIKQAYDAGQRVFGENKAQEMAAKHKELPADIAWHMIGHLQTNKVKYIAPFVALIHSVDSEKLLEEINKQALKNNRTIKCLLQVYIAQEETKFGWAIQEVQPLLTPEFAQKYPAVEIVGLMGMATFTQNKEQIRNEFGNLKRLFDTLKQSELPANVTMTELSMGMSADYKIAIEQGSTLIRIGTAIFGARNYNQES
ncbi:MAG: YggS family pyridoxal phosphate-dependent enzyme [Bacteroidetes bacterium CHB5]|nr:YggS family pyridoxal phosphate-dependent enzyme [Bacteroidetes bacterium CHB5]